MDEKSKKEDVNTEHEKEEKKRDAGLAAPALAVGGERTISKKALEPRSPETKSQQKETSTGGVSDEQAMPLLSPEEAKDFRVRWDAVQVGFVDDPRRAVEQADGLIAVVMKRLAETFADEQQRLESQWNRRGDVSTEDLRLALRRYRSFFSRLLSL